MRAIRPSTKDNSLKIFITGGGSGIGKACVESLSKDHSVTAPSRQELDLKNFSAIANLDLKSYDVVINCAGSNPGAYLGWQNNSNQNQIEQIDVNLTAAMLLIKQYTIQRTQGQFVYFTSTNVDDPIAYNIFYTASKMALRYSVNTIRKECPGIVFTEICPGKVRTNMLKQNYQGTKTSEEIEQMYTRGPVLEAENIASAVNMAIKYSLDKIVISPHEKTPI
jgi:NADP-dependent 3-hydroxy acid dehydrogenase YdfG